MRHPEHPYFKVQLHPAEEQDLEITFTLEKSEELVGFQFFEAKQGAQKTHKVKMNSSLFKEVFNKCSDTMEKPEPPCEAKNSETGASEWYDPHILIRALEKMYVEPLSRHIFYPAALLPGRRRWLPATAKPAFDGTVKGDEAQVEIGVERVRCF